jgi:hypothetical protein
VAKIHTMLIFEKVGKGFAAWEDIEDFEKEIKGPIMVFLDEENNDEFLFALNIVAGTKREMELMLKNEVFYTSSIDEGKYFSADGKIFYGVDPEKVIA